MQDRSAAPSGPSTPPGAEQALPAARAWTRRLWPASAFLCWLLGWLLLAALQPLGPLWALVGALLPVAGLAWLHERRWRRFMVLGGFAASLLLHQGLAGLPAWCWLLSLGLLVLMYPRSTWRDAPLFPTPAGALASLAAHVELPSQARILDAGCGLGAGLRELHRCFPAAEIHGVEWSPLLALACRLRHPWARVRRGDMWAQPWAGYQLVYLFQRPESMAQAEAKAHAELESGAWLISLDFPLPGTPAILNQPLAGRHSVHVYRF
ncbi:class I SAM-dependent methyltransferase [Roseateles flavus]|uniref:Class I SAM-dependent methyltransferase n=1 Tax=Roseateles flavus TaxID=3149041 RepID=A0ABV0GI85_9BURK